MRCGIHCSMKIAPTEIALGNAWNRLPSRNRRGYLESWSGVLNDLDKGMEGKFSARIWWNEQRAKMAPKFGQMCWRRLVQVWCNMHSRTVSMKVVFFPSTINKWIYLSACHSFIIDPDDATYTRHGVFNEEELQEIRTFAVKPVREIPKRVMDFFDEFSYVVMWDIAKTRNCCKNSLGGTSCTRPSSSHVPLMCSSGHSQQTNSPVVALCRNVFVTSRSKAFGGTEA